jgi:hypothetical protein
MGWLVSAFGLWFGAAPSPKTRAISHISMFFSSFAWHCRFPGAAEDKRGWRDETERKFILSAVTRGLNSPYRREGLRGTCSSAGAHLPDQDRKLNGKAEKHPYLVGISTEPGSFGTGILISPKFVLTCGHVLREFTSVEVVSQEGTIPARTVKVDPSLDLALLELERPIAAMSAKFTDSPLRPGVVLLAVGVQETPGQPHRLTVAEIELTYLNKNDADGKILDMQFTGGARPGYSGGPAVVEEGGALHCVGVLRCGGRWAYSTHAIGLGAIRAFVADYIPSATLQEGKLGKKAEGNRQLHRNRGLLSRPLTAAAVLCGVVIFCAIGWHFWPSHTVVGPTSTPQKSTVGPTAGTTPPPTPPQLIQVWVNIPTHVYHCPGSPWYEKTKHGEKMTQAEAQKKGNRPAYGKACK